MSAAPSKARLIAELRALPEFVRFQVASTNLWRLPRGDGHAVIVYPGLVAGDMLTAPLRQTLAALGYAPQGWGQGLNLGFKRRLFDVIQRQLRSAAERSGRKVSLVGWSLGGLYARELAKRLPDKVRSVVTLGAPFHGDMRANNAWRLYEALNDHPVDNPPIDSDLDATPPVPTTSIYSEDDGIVSAVSSQAPDTDSSETIRVSGSHMGLVWNPDVVAIVADRLAQPEGAWRRWRPN